MPDFSGLQTKSLHYDQKPSKSYISLYRLGELNKAEAYLAEGDKINESTESTWPLTRNVLLGEMETKEKFFQSGRTL